MSQDSVANNKRLAKNTFYLYIRTGIIMLVSLYTSRIILETLGVEDFGIYNVVGGIVAFFNVICGSLTVATGRFLSFEIGKGNDKRLKETFSTALNIHIILGLFIILLAEFVGVWFLNTQLNIPTVRLVAANWVFQCSIVSFVISLINVPYSSALISHEHMGVYAYLGLFETVAKLLIVYLLQLTIYDKLVFYGILLMCVQIFVQLSYYFYCKKHFIECRFHFFYNKTLLFRMFSFVGWAFLGNAAVVVKTQGISILLNIFCGPIINAAQGIANQVDSIANRFVYGYMTAANPQIIKYYSTGNLDLMKSLVMRCSRISFFLILLLVSPVILNIDILLNWWLSIVPEHTNMFVILTLIYTSLDSLCNPLVTGVISTGKIKKYEILVSVVYFLMVFFVFISLFLGAMPEFVLILSIIAKFFILLILLFFWKKIFFVNYIEYIRGVVLPLLPATCIFVFSFFIFQTINMTTAEKLGMSLFIVESSLIIAVWYLGFHKHERSFIVRSIISKINH